MKSVFWCQKPLIVLTIIALMSGGFASADTSSDIQDLQKQIEQYQQQIDQVHSQTVTLQGQITVLNAQINQIALELRSLQLSINQTNANIKITQGKIADAEGQIAKDQVLLGQYLLLTYQNDQESLTNILLKNDTLSEFFNDVNTIATNQNDLKDTIENIKDVKTSLDTQEQQLEDQKADLEQQQQLVNIDKRSLDQSKSQKDTLLKQSKGQESSLQSKVDQLKQEIYYLQQNGVSVDDAVKYGNLAAISVGIRPAFLLAELNLESGLGQNVGRCKLVNTSSGASRNINTGAISQNGMNPTRDLPVFLQITSQLGRDPLDSLISCWPGYGWGGAMGPAQFIPSTWVGYASRVSSITGHPIADPWNIQDAFTAAAIKFAKDGATSQTAAGEIAASKAYFCGNPRSTNSKCINYANAVQRLESQIAQNL
jgi:peptidoglycan hydrolase CwlO-like protein